MILAIIGICGNMGNRVYEYYKDKFTIIGIDKNEHKFVKTYPTLRDLKFDIVIDFSSVKLYDELIYALENNKYVLSGTTGYTKEEIDYLSKIGKEKFYWSCNFAKGIPLFLRLITEIKPNYDFFDFVEIHASTKKDAPSGTAKMIADAINLPYSTIQSIRLPLAPAIHEIIFTSSNEKVTLRHEILDYNAFLEGLDIKLGEMMKYDKETIWMRML